MVVVGSVYSCQIAIRPFMSLEVCHSLELKITLGLKDADESANFIELIAHKPCQKPATTNYTIDIHFYAESDPIFATKKHPTSVVA